jgi:putative ABC transport system substrate-binding protein
MRSIRTCLAACVLLLAGAPGNHVHAQPAAKVYRVGVVSPLEASPEPPTVRALRQALRELGYVEGKNLVLETRYANGRPESFPGLVAGLIAQKVDVLVAGSNAGSLAAKQATATVPIVFAGVADAIGTGLFASLARPGGNITGATFGVAGSGIGGKWLEMLAETVPAISHVAVLHNAADSQSREALREIHDAARKLKIRIGLFDANNDASLEKAFAAIAASGARGLIVAGSAYFGGNRVKVVQFVAAKRLPAIYFFSLFPEAGGLMSYGGSTEDSYRRAAYHVDRILKGAKPADLPVDQATRFELVINLKTAKALGLSIPRSLLLRADRVIE